MFKTFQGVTEDSKNLVYLRPETVQGKFVNFKYVQRTSRKKIPIGIAQECQSFRNEIILCNFTFTFDADIFVISEVSSIDFSS